MATTVGNILRLSHAGIVLAQHGVRFVPAGSKPPFALYLARAATLPIRALTWPFRIGQPKARRVAAALASLGPSYMKLGQFLATREDVIGPENWPATCSHLQDKCRAFSMAEARSAVEDAHWAASSKTTSSNSAPRRRRVDRPGAQGLRDRAAAMAPKSVAVKILRPDVESSFKRDLDSYYLRGPQIEHWRAATRRLRPMAVVET